MFAYHGTKPANLNSIKRNGLKKNAGRVYFTTDFGNAYTKGALVLRFPLPPSAVQWLDEGKTTEFHISDGIPAEDLEVHTASGWKRLS
jgi:hypothetical protein